MALYKRKNSKFWWFKFTFDGSLIQQSTKCRNRRDAETVEAAFRTQLALGRIGIKQKPKAPSFGDAVKDFLKWSKIERATTTHRRIEFSFAPLLSYFGETVKTDKIEKKHIESFISHRISQTSRKTGKPITRETVNRELCCLKMLFQRLCDAELLEKNPARLIKKLPENERAFHVITEAERKRYTLAAPPILADVFNLMLETGLRCGEAYQLKRGDINLSGNYLKVTRGKTKSSARRVPLSDVAKKILSARMSRLAGENIFPQNDIDGKQPTDSLIKFHLRTVRALGFDFRIYDARHTFATRAVEDGVDLMTLSAILGHNGLKMLSRYAHPSENLKADAIRKMEKGQAKAARSRKAT